MLTSSLTSHLSCVYVKSATRIICQQMKGFFNQLRNCDCAFFSFSFFFTFFFKSSVKFLFRNDNINLPSWVRIYGADHTGLKASLAVGVPFLPFPSLSFLFFLFSWRDWNLIVSFLDKYASGLSMIKGAYRCQKHCSTVGLCAKV